MIEIIGIAMIFTFPLITSLGILNACALYHSVKEGMMLFAQK
jgi:hypothetical protein